MDRYCKNRYTFDSKNDELTSQRLYDEVVAILKKYHPKPLSHVDYMFPRQVEAPTIVPEDQIELYSKPKKSLDWAGLDQPKPLFNFNSASAAIDKTLPDFVLKPLFKPAPSPNVYDGEWVDGVWVSKKSPVTIYKSKDGEKTTMCNLWQ